MKASNSESSRDVVALTRPLHRPAIQLATKAYMKSAKSYFGGAPPLFDGFEWPESEDYPLVFLACIDLAELNAPPELDWLPTTGRLLFFYDVLDPGWGYDPAHHCKWRVLHFEESRRLRGEAPLPEAIEFDGLEKRRSITFRAIDLPPPWDSAEIEKLQLSGVERERFNQYRDQLYGDGPRHQIGGFADPVQGSNMQLECQLVSNGLYCGNSTGYADPRAKKLAKHASDWQLLLQMDTDDQLDVMWGDAGKIYYWIRKQDAQKKKFDNAWLILQCG